MRVLELIDLAERIVAYQYVLPDGCFANLYLFKLPSFGDRHHQYCWNIGPSLDYTKDESILKRIWKDGLRLEYTDNEIIMHPAEESTIDSPWYTERLEAEFEHRGQRYIYEQRKIIDNPWMPGMRFRFLG